VRTHTAPHLFWPNQCMCNKWQRFIRIPTVPPYIWPNISIQLSWSGKPFVAQMFQRIYDSMSQSIQVSWSGNSSYVHTRHQTILSQMYQCICYGVAIKLKTKYINVSIAKYMNMSTVQLQRFIPSHMIPHYFWPNTSMCLLWSGKRFVVQILEVKILERIHDSKYEYMCCGVATIRMFTHGTMLILAKCTNVSIMEQQTMRSPNIWIYHRRKICVYLFWSSNDLYVCITHVCITYVCITHPTRCGVYDVTNLHIRSNFHVFWLHYPTSISWK